MKFSLKVFLACSAFVFAACDSSNDLAPNVPTEPSAFGKLQILHASADAPTVNVSIDGVETLSNVDYKTASGQAVVLAGTYSVQVDANLPGGTTATVFGPADVTIAEDTITTVSAVGPVAIPLDVSVETIPDADPAAGNARLFVLHATSGPEGLPVDVYVDAYSEPNAPVGTSMPFTFSFKETLGPLEVPAGDYQIRVTLSEDLNPVYDSGLVSLGDGADLTLVAVPNVSGGPAAVTLLALDEDGAGALLDVNTPTGLRVGHLSSDTGAVDVIVNGGEYLADVTFPTITGIAALAPDTYNVAVNPANTGMAAIGPVDLTLDAGTWYSVFAVGLSGDMTLTADILTDDPRPVALYSKVRIYHASPAAGLVDIYVTEEGGFNPDDPDQAPLLADVPFGANTGYLPLAGGTYDVTVTLAGTKTAAISQTIAPEDGGVYTAIARDPAPGSMEFALEVLVDVLNNDT